ncbi:class I adenylate-forming enzyme family protein [Actinomycetospora lutea]|uniref:class I adenylate-forming enzyme family protein n=1 Tax=Actinomycetospora lutea TaxID=663604 RepID=UPI00236618AD|nr:class I adenylate-forming enzyme family protein [Actinomycetospora lutea]MDD7939693.1 class I adenylate-forming enzyme family protein [Actinomycetospora lutea]
MITGTRPARATDPIPGPPGPTVPAVLDDLVARRPHAEAVVGPEGRITWAELGDRAARFAAALADAGIGRGDRVAVLLPNGVRWIVAASAVLRVGAAVVPVNTWYRAAELEHVLGSSGVRMVVTDTRVLGRDTLAELDGAGFARPFRPGAAPGADGYLGALLWPATLDLPSARAPRPLPAPDPGDLALLLFTSGSTARPKPVPLRHGKLVRNGYEIGRRQHLVPGDRLWIAAPFFFGYGCSNALPVALTHGVTLCLQERVAGDESLAFIARERCTVYYGLGATTRNLVGAPSFGRHDISTLRTGTTGFTPEDKRLVVEELGVTEICSMYGLTEAYGHSTVSDAHDDVEVRLQTSGTVVPTQEIRITDPDGTPLPRGTTGEIELRGCVIDGYLGPPELDEGSFRTGGWLRTGDLGFLDDAERLHVVGRRKEMLKVKGINIAPLEIEELLGGHPAVDQAYVVGVPGPEGDEQMVAAVVPRTDATDDATDEHLPAVLTDHVKARAAGYKVPSRIVVLTQGQLPLTDTGKVSKRALRDVLAGEQG